MKETEINRNSDLPPVVCHRYSERGFENLYVSVPEEKEITLYVNGQELVTLQCTPIKLNCLIVGFLYLEGIIEGVNDILFMRVCEDENLADIRIKNQSFAPPTRRILTSGCGGGTTFQSELRKVDSDLKVKPDTILALIKEFNDALRDNKTTAGVHVSALSDTEKVLVICEDVGRHNAVDKVVGECLLRRIDPHGKILFTTGRVSSEMLIKASKMGIPIVVSRHSPTRRALALSEVAGITLVCHARTHMYSVFTFPERVGMEVIEQPRFK